MKTSNLIDGKAAARAIREKLVGHDAALAVIVVGENAASKVYVRNKKRACEEVGIRFYEKKLPEMASTDDVIQAIHDIQDWANGIIVQLPLPPQVDKKRVIEAIPSEKDVDCFTPYNLGRLMRGDGVVLPCTPAGIMNLLGNVSGKHCVVVGRSDIVGKPLAMMLLQADATVTVCHSKTKNLSSFTKQADVLISAVGKPFFITADMVKPGATVIDVGMNRNPITGKLCGDVDFEAVSQIAGSITPVPGGVGPMTVAMLLKNTVTAAEGREHE